MGKIEITTGVFTTTQLPLDSKTFANTLAELQTLGLDDHKAFYYFEKLKVYCAENDLEYQWREEKTVGETGGLLASSYTYPVDAIAGGVDYSGRTFNFFLFRQSSLQGNGTIEVWGNTFTHRKKDGSQGDGVIGLHDIAFNGLAEDPNVLISAMVFMNTLNDMNKNDVENWDILTRQ